MNIRRNIIITVSFVIAIMLVIGFSYAKFIKPEVIGNNNYNVVVGNTISESELIPSYAVNFEDGDAMIDIDEIAPAYQDIVKFKISTNYNDSQDIVIQLLAGVNTTAGNYNLYTCNQSNYNDATYANVSSNCTRISATNDPLPASGIVKQIHTATKITLAAKSTNYYVLTIDALQTFNNFRGYVIVKSYKETTLVNKILAAHPPVSDAITSTYVSSSTGIDFTARSSPTNGQGLYTNTKNSEGGTIKYFRGGTYCAYTNYVSEDTSGTKCIAVGGTWDSTTYHCSLNDSQSTCTGKGFTYYELKNNVMFAGKAWKIVRINGDGTIRLLYNGTSPSARGTASQLSATAFNTNYNAAKYIGYVYDTSTSSTIKGIVDSWYSSNLTSYASSLTDVGFCGDRTGSTSGYGAYIRLKTNKTPSYNCADIANDLYTTSSNGMGNKKLTYPIGLITADEVAYAGSVYGTNNYTYYMQSGSYYWTMSPSYFSGSYAYEFRVLPDGYLNYSYVDIDAPAARPAVSLKSGTLVTSGTGTMADPWIIAS